MSAICFHGRSAVKSQIARQIKSDWQQRQRETEKESGRVRGVEAFNCSDNARCVFHIRIIYPHSFCFFAFVCAATATAAAFFFSPLSSPSLSLPLSYFLSQLQLNNDRNYCCASLICQQTMLSYRLFSSLFSSLFFSSLFFVLSLFPTPLQHFGKLHKFFYI